MGVIVRLEANWVFAMAVDVAAVAGAAVAGAATVAASVALVMAMAVVVAAATAAVVVMDAVAAAGVAMGVAVVAWVEKAEEVEGDDVVGGAVEKVGAAGAAVGEACNDPHNLYSRSRWRTGRTRCLDHHRCTCHHHASQRQLHYCSCSMCSHSTASEGWEGEREGAAAYDGRGGDHCFWRRLKPRGARRLARRSSDQRGR